MSSEYQELLEKLLNSDTTDIIPQSRSEYIMLTAINSIGLENLPEPGSRMEAYLMALIAKMGEGGSASGDVDLSGYIKSPTAAAIGQTIRVSAVDENGKPTEWEAVDMVSIPAVTTANNGQFLRVVNGAWAASTVPNAEEASF